jgi:hypothetical protein
MVVILLLGAAGGSLQSLMTLWLRAKGWPTVDDSRALQFVNLAILAVIIALIYVATSLYRRWWPFAKRARRKNLPFLGQ